MKLPAFLSDVKLTEKDAARLQGHMANWLTAHAHIRTLTADTKGMRELELMLVYEITRSKRLHMLHRLRSRYNNLRMQHEDRQLFELANG